MNVLHHLAMQSEALVILLQETHCTDAEKLVLPHYQLAGSSLSRKHGLATFVHERLRYTLLDQSPPTSEIEWLCVDVDGYKIVNVYKPPPTRLRTLDLPVFPHPCLYAGDFNCRHADWGYDDNSPDGECLAGWASINCLALLYNAKDAASIYSGRWNTGTNPDLAFASVGLNSRLPDRRVLDKFPRSQHRPSLITQPRFAMAVPSMPVKRWNFRKANWSHYIALTEYRSERIFPNFSVSLRVFLAAPATVASAERSFSKFKIIKNYFRFTIVPHSESLPSLAPNSSNYREAIRAFPNHTAGFPTRLIAL